ncbi:LolA family protein [Bizionia myxarmorum]|uniref:Outer membrane lipoprotein carrier protein LolA n=1 Tax=Bizionia myxarmorum TaxID=291186 RepID=A0A5D0RDE7_9FLAO|nr:outer membrane lipoprotein carrier protein LolA [Bizionia myxarmorum]TYB78594.1 outer membrane lipoprotein carrier protein LolA [Bizionia myxarmorum]
MSTDEANALKNLVKQQAKTTKTITSDFVQYKHMDFLSNDIVTKGNLHFKAPNLVKWAYLEPFVYSVIFKNDQLYINDEGKKSNIDMSSSKLFKQLNGLIINSVKGDMFDAEEFTIEYFKMGGNSLVYFKPKEKKSAAFIEAFHLTFNAKGEVEIVKMIEPSGDYTKIVFSNKVLNNQISDALFNN